jgi:hypothetical protein
MARAFDISRLSEEFFIINKPKNYSMKPYMFAFMYILEVNVNIVCKKRSVQREL